MIEEFPFPHQSFGTTPQGPYDLIGPDLAVPTESPSSADVVGLGKRMREENVREVVLVHGTFAGNDIIGLMRRFSRFSPRVSRMMKELGKKWFDQLANEVGNYTADYAEHLAGMLATESGSSLPVTRYCWSGENNHLGRACGVLALLEKILHRDWAVGERVIFLAHSHGGNLLAMLSLLVGASEQSKRAFLRATHLHYPLQGQHGDQTNWERTRSILLQDDLRSKLPIIDVVTFGTPLRYGWNMSSVERLLHIVQHRPLVPGEPWRAAIPKSPSDAIHAVAGDYVQQLGIGGTDFPHSPFAWKSCRAERRLRRIFEPSIRRRDLKKHLLEGRRVGLDGKTLLVNYPSTAEEWNEKLLGHGVYTCSPWLPFHLRAIAREFYGMYPNLDPLPCP